MYIKKDFLSLKVNEISGYTANGYALCYVERCDRLDILDQEHETTHSGFMLFFTEADLRKQWGDDWNFAPYNCNAGWPYDVTGYKDKDGNWHRTKHTILVLNISIDNKHCPTMPEEYGGYNSLFSVETINQGACAWMFFGNECEPVYAGATPLDVFERIGKWLAPCPFITDEYDEG